MSKDYGAITSAALALSEAERADLAARLLDSLEIAAEQESVDAAWREEIRRRAAASAAGDTPGIPWEEVKAMLLEQAETHGLR
ncbi:MAG: addiction module protein [Planctomycetaceae bacterium]